MSIALWAGVVYGIALAVAGGWAMLRAIRRCHRCRNPKYGCFCTEGRLR